MQCWGRILFSGWDTHPRREMSSRRSISNGGTGPGLHGGRIALTHSDDWPVFILSIQAWDMEGKGRRDKVTLQRVSRILLNLAGADSENLSSNQRTICPLPTSTMACYIMCVLIIHVAFSWSHFPKTIFPKWGHNQHWLWRICFSKQSNKANEIFRIDFKNEIK